MQRVGHDWVTNIYSTHIVFWIVMYRCESWTIKKAECWRVGAFELWCWRRLLRVPWTARRSNQSILKKINTVFSLEGLMLNWSSNTLATWCEEPTHWKRLWWWERLRAGGEEGNRGWDGWMVSLTQWIWVWANSGRQWRTREPGMLQSMGSQRVRHDWGTEHTHTVLRCSDSSDGESPLSVGCPERAHSYDHFAKSVRVRAGLNLSCQSQLPCLSV